MNKLIALIAAITLIVGGVIWWKIPRDPSFPVPMAEAESILAGIEPPGEVYGSAPVTFEAVPKGPGRIDWTVKQDGEEVMRFLATLTPDGESATRVKLDLKGATAGPFGNVEQRMQERGSIARVYKMAMEERVAAALEKREYDILKIMPMVAVAALANSDAITGQFDAAEKAYNERDRESIEPAYEEEGQGY